MADLSSATDEYKGTKVPTRLRAVIPYMLDLELVRERLSALGSQWDLLTILGQVCGTGTDVTTTREEFNILTHELIRHLGQETLEKFEDMLRFKAQVAIDIVVRNLFERTADIGFLSTDDDIREFAERADKHGVDAALDLQTALRQRFAEYVAKYSVYSDIVVLDRDGIVLCRLDEAPAPTACGNSFVKEALVTEQPYVEYFGPCDLYPNQGDKLLYAYRITHPSGENLAVLCLTFAFENELRTVFGNLIPRRDWTVLGLLDAEGRVIASSDPLQMPKGVQVEAGPLTQPEVIHLGGRAYLARACRTNGYQGYAGPGWCGCALLPLAHAFEVSTAIAAVAPSHFVETITSNEDLFSQSLRDVARKAAQVQAELDRTVWNGHLPQNESQTVQNVAARKVLLREISATGSRTKQVFERSIGNLYQTVLSSVLTDARYAAALAIDIMDRNLYERANDCRWWALTTSFRNSLDGARVDVETRGSLEEVLKYINRLYTVYTGLFLFDTTGRIVASSCGLEPGSLALAPQDTRRILSLKTTQDYIVSPFEQSELYDGRHTYVYAAAIRSLQGDRVTGGVGIVFDSEPQFRQMLLDSLPRDASGKTLPGCFALFVERSGRVLACSNERHVPGEKSDVPLPFLRLANGASLAEVVQLNDGLYAVGGECSHGYREYKSAQDGYRNDVICLVYLRLADVPQETLTTVARTPPSPFPRRNINEACISVATARVGNIWLGFRAEDVAEAIPLGTITTIPSGSQALKGLVRYRQTAAPVIDPRHLLPEGCSPQSEGENLLVVRVDGNYVGLIVDELGEVPDIPLRAIEATGTTLGTDSNYLEGVIKPDQHSSKEALTLLLRTKPFIELVLGEKLALEGFSVMQAVMDRTSAKAAE